MIIKCQDSKRKLKKIPIADQPGLPTYYACIVDKNGNQVFNSPKSDVYVEKHCAGKVEQSTMNVKNFINWINSCLNVENEPSWESTLVNDCYNR